MTVAGPEAAATPAVSTVATRRCWAAFAVVLAGAFMDSLDATMLTVLVPTIQADLGASDAVAQWSVAGYLLAFAVLLVTGGRCGDVYGRRRTFAVGVLVFLVASVWCGLSVSGASLAAGRTMQGVGAAIMVPQAAALVTSMFPREQWPAAFGVFGAVLGLGSVCGPVVGGLLTAADIGGLGWRTAFFVNVPVCLLALAGARWIPDDGHGRSGSLDRVGVLLSASAASAVLFALVNGRELGWPWWIGACVVVGLVLARAFWNHQVERDARGGDALVPPVLFRTPGFASGLLVVLLVHLAVTSTFLVMTYVLQGGFGWSIVRTALVTTAWPLGIAATFQIAWRAAAGRERRLVAVGCVVMAGGLLGLAGSFAGADADPSTWSVVAALAALGGGMGLTSPVLTALVLGPVPAEHNGAGSGVMNATVQLGAAAGVAAVGTVFFVLVDAGAETARAGALALVPSTALLLVAAGLSARLSPAPSPSLQEEPS